MICPQPYICRIPYTLQTTTMKKILLIPAAVAFGGIALVIIMAGTSKMPGVKTSSVATDTVSARTAISADPPLPGLINSLVAETMSADYKADAGKSTVKDSTGKKQTDALSIWFDLETVKKFIDKIDKSIPKSATRPLLGIRMYYAKYPSVYGLTQKTGLQTLSKQVAYRHTLFMVPTYYDKQANLNVDFNFDLVGNPAHPTPYFKLLHTGLGEAPPSILGLSNDQFIYKQKAARVKSFEDGIQNHGGLMPPPAGQGTFPTPASQEQMQ